LTELLAEEFSDRGIHVNAIALGAVDTPMLANAFPDFKTEVTPERIAEYIYRLTTSDYKLLNGKTIELTATTP
jgi:NAD(P)-dependent dehydrogenase (short-subunit alcohol dehydrogenase family)